jgi:hypothetical protein
MWWIAIAGTALIVGGVAWLLKLWVIVATDGWVMYTGAAGAFFDLGLYLLLIGSTGLGLRLTMKEEPAFRIAAVVASPVAFVVSFAVLLGIGYTIVSIGRAVVGNAVPSYLLEEGGIFITAVLWLVIGVTLVLGSVRRSRGVVSSEAGQTARVR